MAGREERVTSALLLGSSGALGWRSWEQQQEMEDLEATNTTMSSAMWAWREELFALAAAPSPPITASRLRDGEEEPALPASKQPGPDGEESFTVA